MSSQLPLPDSPPIPPSEERIWFMPYKLLMTGSRVTAAAKTLMFAKARRAIARAKANGWHVVVGDAEGMDAEVLRLCFEFQVPFVCYGPDDLPRCLHPTRGESALAGVWDGAPCSLGEFVQSKPNPRDKRSKYIQRDEVMARIADRCFAICYKFSHGTLATYHFAEALKRPADIAYFDERGEITASGELIEANPKG